MDLAWRGKKTFWYINSNKDGRIGAKFPDGTEYFLSKTEMNNCSISEDPFINDGYIRENIYIDINGVWDLTEFAAGMSAILVRKVNDCVYYFASVSHADKTLFPFLTDEQIEVCKNKVKEFYSDPNTQAGWKSFILHPIVIKKFNGKFAIISLKELGYSEDVIDEFKSSVISTLDQELIFY